MQTSLDTFSKRLMKLIDNKGFKNPNEFGKALGYSNSEKIFRLLRDDKNKPSYEVLQDISNKFGDVNTRWLLTGEGEMLNEMHLENKAHSKQNNLEVTVKPESIEITPIERTHIISEEGVELIPIVDINAAAGDGYINPSYFDPSEVMHFPKRLLQPGFHLTIRVKGESMAPSIKDGDYAVIRRVEKSDWINIMDKRVYLIVDTDGGLRIKRIKNRLKKQGFIILTSDNPDKASFPNVYMSHEEIVGVWYVAFTLDFHLANVHDQYYAKLQTVEDRLDDLDRKQNDVEEMLKKYLKT